jgi:hypothetical protein
VSFVFTLTLLSHNGIAIIGAIFASYPSRCLPQGCQQTPTAVPTPAGVDQPRAVDVLPPQALLLPRHRNSQSHDPQNHPPLSLVNRRRQLPPLHRLRMMSLMLLSMLMW